MTKRRNRIKDPYSMSPNDGSRTISFPTTDTRDILYVATDASFSTGTEPGSIACINSHGDYRMETIKAKNNNEAEVAALLMGLEEGTYNNSRMVVVTDSMLVSDFFYRALEGHSKGTTPAWRRLNRYYEQLKAILYATGFDSIQVYRVSGHKNSSFPLHTAADKLATMERLTARGELTKERKADLFAAVDAQLDLFDGWLVENPEIAWGHELEISSPEGSRIASHKGITTPEKETTVTPTP